MFEILCYSFLSDLFNTLLYYIIIITNMDLLPFKSCLMVVFFFCFFETIPGTKERKYHCNYCNKDISGMIRIKCATCADFDLCVECFSVGAEVSPHKSSHAYRVMVGATVFFGMIIPVSLCLLCLS